MYNLGFFGQGMNVYLWGPFLILLTLWSLFWKGLALWHASRRGQPWWFIALLFINTAGILEMVYLFGVAKLKPEGLFKIK